MRNIYKTRRQINDEDALLPRNFYLANDNRNFFFFSCFVCVYVEVPTYVYVYVVHKSAG